MREEHVVAWTWMPTKFMTGKYCHWKQGIIHFIWGLSHCIVLTKNRKWDYVQNLGKIHMVKLTLIGLNTIHQKSHYDQKKTANL